MKNAMLTAVAFLFTGSNALAEEAIDVGSRKQLFIDERFIAENDGITLAVNPPRKEEAVSRSEMPWENKRAGLFSIPVPSDTRASGHFASTRRSGRPQAGARPDST